MSIKRKLLLILLILLISAGVFSYLIYISLENYRSAIKTVEIANTVAVHVIERRIVADDYILSEVERAKIQWISIQTELESLVDRNQGLFQNQSEKNLVIGIKHKFKESETTFSEIVALTEQKDVAPSDSMRQYKKARLLSELTLEMQETISLSKELADSNKKEAQDAQDYVIFLFSVALAFYLLLLFLILLLTWKTIIQPLSKMQKGTKLIASGDLDFRMGIRSKDEIGDLAQSLDIMAAQLKNSREGLENTVKERTASLNQKVQELSIEKEKAEKSSAKDDAILASLGDGMFVTDQQGKVVRINKPAVTLLGYENENDFLQKDFCRVIRAEDEHRKELPDSQRPIELGFRQRRLISQQIFYEKKDGTMLPVSLTISPIIFEGRSIGTIEIFRDITYERAVDQMKSEFISLASHQLRTPLSAMKWFLEMLLEGDAGKLNKEQTDFVKNIDESNERMIDLVNSLLNVSRIESGRIIIEPELTDMNTLIESIRKELENKFVAKHQTVLISCNSNLPKILLDPKLIRQVYINLLTNANKYTPDGGEISVFISKTETDLVSQVSDNGYGIPKKDHEKVFQKFYRGENIIKIVSDGNGLGMYLVKAIITSSKGRIWFESEEGKGSTFYFSLPLSGMEAKKGEVRLDS